MCTRARRVELIRSRARFILFIIFFVQTATRVCALVFRRLFACLSLAPSARPSRTLWDALVHNLFCCRPHHTTRALAAKTQADPHTLCVCVYLISSVVRARFVICNALPQTKSVRESFVKKPTTDVFLQWSNIVDSLAVCDLLQKRRFSF